MGEPVASRVLLWSEMAPTCLWAQNQLPLVLAKGRFQGLPGWRRERPGPRYVASRQLRDLERRDAKPYGLSLCLWRAVEFRGLPHFAAPTEAVRSEG